MRRTGARIASPLVMAEAQLWIIDGWMALGVCTAFVVSMALGRIGTTQASASAAFRITWQLVRWPTAMALGLADVHAVGASGDVDGTLHQRLVQRHQRVAEAPDAGS